MININLDHIQNASIFLKKVTIDSKKLSTVEVNVSIVTAYVAGVRLTVLVGSVVGAFFCAGVFGIGLNTHGMSILFGSKYASQTAYRLGLPAVFEMDNFQ